MATLGMFTEKDGRYTGTIRSLTMNVKAQFVPVEKRSKDGPDYRIFAGGAELGAAWRKESKDGETPYLSVKLDDPSFDKPVSAALFDLEDGGVLVWNRHRTN